VRGSAQDDERREQDGDTAIVEIAAASTNVTIARGIEKYESAITMSEIAWSATRSGRHKRHIPCGRNPAELNR
jgi:hypothetical protein